MGLELIISTLGRISEALNDRASPKSKLEAQAWIVNGKVRLVSEGLISCINEPTAKNKFRTEALGGFELVASPALPREGAQGSARGYRDMMSLGLQAREGLKLNHSDRGPCCLLHPGPVTMRGRKHP